MRLGTIKRYKISTEDGRDIKPPGGYLDYSGSRRGIRESFDHGHSPMVGSDDTHSGDGA